MPAFESGPGEIRYLIPAIAGAAELHGSALIHMRDDPVIGQREPSRRGLAMEWRAFVQGEAVGGNMLGSERNGRVHRLLPLAHGLSRYAVDQVNADIGKSRVPRKTHGSNSLGRGMKSAENLKHVIGERLYAQTEPVYASLDQKRENLARDRIRVRLNREFRIIRDPEVFADDFGHPRQLARGERGRRPASQVNALEYPLRESGLIAVSLNLKTANKLVSAAGSVRSGIKTTVQTLSDTKRYMDIER